jgi:hypothetical protein
MEIVLVVKSTPYNQITATTTTASISNSYSTCNDCQESQNPLQTHIYFSSCDSSTVYRAVLVDFENELGGVTLGTTYLLEDISDLPNGCYTVVGETTPYTNFIGYGASSSKTPTEGCEDTECILPSPTPSPTPSVTPTPTPSVIETYIVMSACCRDFTFRIKYGSEQIVNVGSTYNISVPNGDYEYFYGCATAIASEEFDSDYSAEITTFGNSGLPYDECIECLSEADCCVSGFVGTEIVSYTDCCGVQYINVSRIPETYVCLDTSYPFSGINVSHGITQNCEVSCVSPTPTPSITPTQTPSVTPEASVSVTPSVTPSVTVTNTPSVTSSNTPTQTPSVTPSNTASVTPSVTPSVTVTNTPSVTPTVSVTSTPSLTPGASVSNTPSNTPTITPSTTPSITPSVTQSVTPTVSVTSTPSLTPGASVSNTPSNTPTITPSTTPTITPSVTPTVTPTVTPSITPSVTITSTPLTSTPSITPSTSISVTPSNTPPESVSVTPSVSVTTTPSVTPTVSITPSVTPSQSMPGSVADKLESCETSTQSQKVFVFYDGTSLSDVSALEASESIRSWYQTKVTNGDLLSGNLYEGVIGETYNNGENWLWWASYPYLGSLTGSSLSFNIGRMNTEVNSSVT